MGLIGGNSLKLGSCSNLDVYNFASFLGHIET